LGCETYIFQFLQSSSLGLLLSKFVCHGSGERNHFGLQLSGVSEGADRCLIAREEQGKAGGIQRPLVQIQRAFKK
jgi:hypothetical protein